MSRFSLDLCSPLLGCIQFAGIELASGFFDDRHILRSEFLFSLIVWTAGVFSFGARCGHFWELQRLHLAYLLDDQRRSSKFFAFLVSIVVPEDFRRSSCLHWYESALTWKNSNIGSPSVTIIQHNIETVTLYFCILYLVYYFLVITCLLACYYGLRELSN